MAISIGVIIRQVAESKGFTQEALGKVINLHEKTVADIYKRVTCDTGLLLTLSDKLQHDFFQYYYEEEPLKNLLKGKLDELQTELQVLRTSFSQKELYIKKIEETISDKANIIELLKDKIVLLERSMPYNNQNQANPGPEVTKQQPKKKK